METITFAELGLSAKVLEAITAAGYSIPTPIQAKAIPVALTGRDVLGIAQTGTGKTASFTLPMISRLETGRARARMPRSLILAPTRELAAQVAQSFEKYGVNHKLDVALLIGGVSMDDQTRKLERGVDVLIATPGRLLDHFQRGRILLMGVEILVIDEADRMLDMGFIPDIEKICKLLPPARQTLFFSATMPPEITRLVHTFMRDPERIEVAPPATTAKTITQRFVYTRNGEDWDKREMLRGLLRQDGVRNAIIFCNRKVDVAILHKSLVKHGFNAGCLHGDMEQRNRTETLDKFRSGEIAFLVASDVAARGLDIPDVSHVFNYDLPRDKDDYVHRIGRTGRAGKEGHATSIVASIDLKQLLEIQKMGNADVTWFGEAPTDEDYAEAGKRRRGKAGPPARVGRPERSGERNRDARGHDHGRSRPVHGERLPREPGAGAVAEGGRPARADSTRPDAARPDAARADSTRPDAARPDRSSRPARPPRPDRASRPERQPMDRDPAAASERPSRNGGSDRHRADRPRPEHARANQPHEEQPREEHLGVREPERNQVRAAPEPARGAPADRRPRPASRDGARPGAPARPEGRHRAAGGEARANSNAGGSAGFADNVPAFLKRPSRPAKAASDT